MIQDVFKNQEKNTWLKKIGRHMRNKDLTFSEFEKVKEIFFICYNSHHISIPEKGIPNAPLHYRTILEDKRKSIHFLE